MKINYGQENLNTLLNQIKNGAMSVPSFQREFTWSSSDMARLMTSIAITKEPFGSIVVWNDPSVSKKIPQTNEIFEQINKNENDSTRQYLIDGQQRVTSFAQLYLIANNENATHVTKGKKIYLDIENENQLKFVAKEKQVKYLFPAFYLFKKKEDYMTALKDFLKSSEYEEDGIEWKQELLLTAVSVYDAFSNITFGTVKIDSEDLNAVIDVFTLINTKGKRLSPFNIVHASFTKQNKSFDLAKEFKNINQYVKKNLRLPKQWKISDNMLMSILYSVLDNTISNKKMIDLSSTDEKAAENVARKILYIKDKDGYRKLIKHTIKALAEIGFSKLESLPSNLYLNIVARYIHIKANDKRLGVDEKQKLNNFFKLSIINERHTSGDDGIKQNGFLEDSNNLIRDNAFNWAKKDVFDAETVMDQNYKGTSALAKYIVAKMTNNLKSFRTGEKVSFNDVSEWKLNLHHIFPKGSEYKEQERINSLMNITPLEFDENNDISDTVPKEYLKNSSPESRKLALINNEFVNFKSFVEERCREITKKLNEEW